MKKKKIKRVISKADKMNYIWIYALLTLLAVISYLPLHTILVNATRSSGSISRGISLIPEGNLIRNYKILSMSSVNVWRCLLNSIMISVPSTILSAYFGALTAYGFAMYRFKGKNILFTFILLMLMVPQQLGIIGAFEMYKTLGMLDTYFPIWIPSIANITTVFFVKQYTEQTLSRTLLEAGRIDGAGEFKIFHKLALPIMIPAVLTMSIFNFVTNWNSLLVPLIIIFDNEKYPLPILLSIIRGVPGAGGQGVIALVISISILPIIFVFVVCSKYIIKGISMGGIKE